MKKILFGKYLKERQTENGLMFYWYQLNIVELISLFVLTMLSVYLIGFYMHWQEVWGLRILPLNTFAICILLTLIFLLFTQLSLNRKAVLLIENDMIIFKRRPLTGKRWKIHRNEVTGFGTKLESQFYENDTGYYPDIYRVYFYLTKNRKIKIGGFNKEDCERISASLDLPKK